MRSKVFFKLWNTYFMLCNFGNGDEFDPSMPQVPIAERQDVDRWLLSNLQLLIKDARAAWTGSLCERPDVPMRIEAAAYRGKPVYFELIGPWTRPARGQHGDHPGLSQSVIGSADGVEIDPERHRDLPHRRHLLARLEQPRTYGPEHLVPYLHVDQNAGRLP